MTASPTDGPVPGPALRVPGATRRPGATPEIRVSDKDRENVLEILTLAAGDGRLTMEELNDRVEIALSARTRSDLAVLTADLPVDRGAGGGSFEPGSFEPGSLAKDRVRIDLQFGTAVRTGPWAVPRSMEIRLTGGLVKLDFSEAIVTHHAMRIHLTGKSGSLVLVTRPGISIDVDDLEVRHGNVRVKPTYGKSRQRNLRIEISGHLKAGSVLARPQRRTLLRWALHRRRRGIFS